MRALSAYRFDLPPEQIAQAPADRRDDARVLAVGEKGQSEHPFRDLPALLPEGAVVVVNDTRVLPARLRARKPTGGAVELLALEPCWAREPCRAHEPETARQGAGDRGGAHYWRCLIKSKRPLRPGTWLQVVGGGAAGGGATGSGARVRVVEIPEPGAAVVAFERPAAEIFEAFGEVPLPPYIQRPRGPSCRDAERYQTVFARAPGAVAAPTAGLHFTPELLRALEERGFSIAPLTLHVGLGTFAPVRTENLDEHELHAERYEIPEATAALASSGRPVVAVGTTVVRALESATDASGRVAPGPGETNLFIRPGFAFRVVDHMVTNFHLPESTLLVLVCAFAGYERTMAAYRDAVQRGFRFYSYGDAMLASRARSP